MSACMILLKPKYDKLFDSLDDLFNWVKEDFDNNSYIIKSDQLLAFKGYKSYRRYKKLLDKLDWNTLYDDEFGKREYVTCNVVQYRQGWFFTDKFFYHKKPSTCICTTKRGMINAMKKYIDFEDKYHQAKYFDDKHIGVEVFNAFIEAWEDGMIFKMSW